MNDPVLPDEEMAEEPQALPQPPLQAPAQNDDRIGALERHMVELTQAIRDTAQRLVPPAASQGTAEDFLNQMAQDPQGAIRRIAQETYASSAGETLTPAVSQVLEMAKQQLLTQHEMRVDNEFGTGTWAEVFKPAVERDLAQLQKTNPHAIANGEIVGALVDRQFGGPNFEKLMERRKALDDGRARGITNLVPGGGYPRLREAAADSMPGDVEGFLRDVERATGENIDRKHFSKLYKTGRESGPGRHRTDLLEYLRATGADPDTLKHYGGERGR